MSIFLDRMHLVVEPRESTLEKFDRSHYWTRIGMSLRTDEGRLFGASAVACVAALVVFAVTSHFLLVGISALFLITSLYCLHTHSKGFEIIRPKDPHFCRPYSETGFRNLAPDGADSPPDSPRRAKRPNRFSYPPDQQTRAPEDEEKEEELAPQNGEVRKDPDDRKELDEVFVKGIDLVEEKGSKRMYVNEDPERVQRAGLCCLFQRFFS